MEVTELASSLISIPSTIGETSQIEEFTASYLDKIRDADVELQAVPNHGRNVIAKSIKGRGFPTIILNGHLDTVEVCNGWERDPFKPAIEGDRLYGLGSADMKSGVAIGMKAFQMMSKLEKVNSIFVGTIDEEGDSSGAFKFLETGTKADLCLIPEPSSGTLMMGCRGRMVFDVEVKGISAHGAKPEEGVNAISEAAKFIAALGELPIMEHELLPRGSCCVLEFHGGTKTLSVPDYARFKLDRHHVLGEEGDDIIKGISDCASSINSRADFEIVPTKSRNTPFLKPFLTENKGLVSDFKELSGADITYGKSVGDYNALAQYMPTIVFGPHGENWHSSDEWASVQSINGVMEVYRQFVDNLSRKAF